MLERVTRPASLADLAYARIREGILSEGMLNERRVSVVALADRLGMSRSPVRSAVERLVSEGLVTLQPAGVSLVEHSHSDLLKLLEVRAVLEGLSAQLATPRLDGGVLSRLEDTQRRFELAVEKNDVATARAHDLQFHQTVMEHADNEVLVDELTRVQARVIVGTYTIAWNPQQHQAVLEHRAILDAMRGGDAGEAARCSIEHMHCLMERIRDAAT